MDGILVDFSNYTKSIPGTLRSLSSKSRIGNAPPFLLLLGGNFAQVIFEIRTGVLLCLRRMLNCHVDKIFQKSQVDKFSSWISSDSSESSQNLGVRIRVIGVLLNPTVGFGRIPTVRPANDSVTRFPIGFCRVWQIPQVTIGLVLDYSTCEGKEKEGYSKSSQS